jgi:YVTN family beta-propeller protein
VFGLAPVGWSPHEITVSPDRTQIFVVNYDGDRFGAGSISILSATSRREIDRLDLYPYGGFHGLAATRSGTYLYVASETRRSILEINLLSRLIERTFPLPHGTPNQIVLDPTETRLYVTDADGPLLYAVNLTGSDITETHVGEGPGASRSPDGSAVWVANRDDGSVSVLDPYTLALITTVVSGRAPVRIAFGPDGARAVVVNAGDGSVAIFDCHTRARLGSIPVGTYPLGVAMDPDGTKAYVVSTRDNDISVVDLTRNIVLERIRVGAVPYDVEFVEIR